MTTPTTNNPTVSLIVTTYNWPEALELVLASVARQSRLPDEVIVADDGSRADTRQLLERTAGSFPVPLRHAWQEDLGFRAARSRNRAIAAARGDYLLLIDGDVLLHRQFVADHLRFARPGCFAQGQRALLGPGLSADLLSQRRLDVRFWQVDVEQRRRLARCPPLARLRLRPRDDLNAVMSCNQGFWRADLLAVNGFDEDMTGWGYEDIDLAARCLHQGLRKLMLKFCAVALHLHHPARGNLDRANPNRDRFELTLADQRTRCALGVATHLPEFAAAPLTDLRVPSAPNPSQESPCLPA